MTCPHTCNGRQARGQHNLLPQVEFHENFIMCAKLFSNIFFAGAIVVIKVRDDEKCISRSLMMKRNVSIEWTMATIGNRSLALTTRCHSSDSNLFLFIFSALFWACLSVSDTFQRAEAQNQRATQSVINFPITMTKTATNAIRENQIFHLTINDGTAEWYPLLEKHGGNWKCG